MQMKALRTRLVVSYNLVPYMTYHSRLCASHKTARPIVHDAHAERAAVHTILFGARAGLG